jgi:hypothetical protein
VLQQVLPAMRAQGGGRIVLMSSIGGVIGIPFQAFYSASKFALEGLGEALAYEVAPLGVHVTLVEPGTVKTDFTASRRTAQAAVGDPVYGAALTKAVGLMERDEANGVPAADVAAVVRRVLESRRPPRRVSAGKAASERACWPSDCCRSAPSRPRRRAAWESYDRTSTGPGPGPCWPAAVRVLGQCRNALLPAPSASRTEADALSANSRTPVGETMPA